MVREIVLDTETTGTDPLKGDRIVEIGCVELINHVPTGQSFQCYLNPEYPVSPGAFNVHGLSNEFLADKPLFKDIVDDFEAFIKDTKLIIHNAPFDVGFLNHELARLKRFPLKPDLILDTLLLARRKHPGASNSLDALCARYGINNNHRSKHGALLDSEILSEVYLELIGGKQTDLGLHPQKQLPSGKIAQVETIRVKRFKDRAYKPRLTEDEKKKHQVFVEKLGASAVWKLYQKD
jgi:DNA polymerase III subunit epsilon